MEPEPLSPITGSNAAVVACGNDGRAPPQAGARGFTLIEICVVIFIVGILATYLTLSIGNRPLNDRMKVQADRLQQLIGLAIDRAQLTSTQIGLQIGADGYRFLHLDGDRNWIAYANGPLRQRSLPKPFEFRLHIDQHAIQAKALPHPIHPTGAGFDDVTAVDGSTTDADDTAGTAALGAPVQGSDDGDDDSKKVVPQILILSSGETTAFQLDIVVPGDKLSYRLSADALGRVKLQQEVLE